MSINASHAACFLRCVKVSPRLADHQQKTTIVSTAEMNKEKDKKKKEKKKNPVHGR